MTFFLPLFYVQVNPHYLQIPYLWSCLLGKTFCNTKINFVDINRYVQCSKKCELSNKHISSWGQNDILLSYLGSQTINKCPFVICLVPHFRHFFFFGFLLVISLLKMSPKDTDKLWPFFLNTGRQKNVPHGENTCVSSFFLEWATGL